MTNEHNPHHYATVDNNDTSIAQITDAVDFPHTGLIKALSLGIKGNYVVKGSATDFDITQSAHSGSGDGGNVVVVAAGKIFRDGALHTVATANFTATSFQATQHTHHLLVADIGTCGTGAHTDEATCVAAHSSQWNPTPILQIRKHGSSTQNAIPPYTEGDTIIAVLTYTGTSSTNGFNAMNVQFLTTGKVANNVSIGYGTSAYTEAMSISASAGDTTIENKVSDKDIIFKVNDGGTPTEVMRIDGSTSRVGIGETAPDSMLHLKSADAASPTIKIENTGTGFESEIIFQRTGTAAASQDIGHIKFKALDDGGATHTYGSVFVDVHDETGGTEDGRFLFSVAKGGTDNTEILRLSGSDGFVFNDQSKDMNFRIESNGNANMLFVDGGNDNVGIGTNSNDANAILTVEGAISLDEISAPSNTADRGQLYTNADNHLHFINGAGTDVKVTEEVFIVALSDETTDLTTGNGKASFHMPFAMTLTAVKANCTTAPTGATILVDINEAGSTIFSTQSNRPTIAIGATSANAAGIDDTALANDALITFDIDQIGSTAAGKGLKVTLYGYRA